MPTLMGRDSDDPRALGEVGHCGVAIDSAADMDVLFDGIPLGDVDDVDDDQRPGRPGLLHVPGGRRAAGRRPIGRLNGTLQTDIFKEYIAQKEWLFAPEPHLRLIGDLMEYCAAEIPAYKPMSVSGYHIREAGSTAAQELAFTLADGFGYVELGLSRGLDVEQFAPGLSFFFDAHIDFFEEIAKFRAARRIWARWLRDVYGATTRAGAVAAVPHPDRRGLADRAAAGQQHRPDRGRGARGRARRDQLAAHQRAGRGAGAARRERAAQIALRTQQVIAEETGVINVADPLGGSWYVEALTDEIERQAEEIFARIREMGARRHDDRRASCAGSRTAGSPARSPRPRSTTSSSWRRATRRSSASTPT